MNNPAYVVYNQNGLIVYVCEWNYLDLPDGLQCEHGNWPKDISSRWLYYKCYRDSENNYRLTEELHSDPSEVLQG